ncbi:MAG: sulfatase-like hydrolase/transferase, partial [Bacteroidota bacterium]
MIPRTIFHRAPRFILLCTIFPLFLQAQSPNIILILADDQGWNGTSVQVDTNEAQSASDYYHTPQLERLAAEGMTFSRAYAPSPKCSPSRASILSGYTTAKTGVTETGATVATDSLLLDVLTLSGLDANFTVYPELLKSLSTPYMTAHFGKWHLDSSGPSAHGFERSDGNTTNLASQGSSTQPDPKKIFSITDSAFAVITDATDANQPFYLHLSHYAVHTPLESTQASLSMFGDTLAHPPGTIHSDSLYAGMTFDLDSAVGLLLDTLSALGIANNTYVIYTSDNGGARGQSNNAPLTRGKTFLSEGGLRVPMFVKGPGIPAGSRSDVPVVGYDFYPTVIEWATGSTNLVPADVEGGSLKALLEATGSVTRANGLVFHSPHYSDSSTKRPRSALIRDDYKLYIDYDAGTFSLFDVEQDLRENSDLAAQLPEVVDSLCLELRDHLKSVNAQMPTLNPGHPTNLGSSPDADKDGLDDDWEFSEMLTHLYGAADDP